MRPELNQVAAALPMNCQAGVLPAAGAPTPEHSSTALGELLVDPSVSRAKFEREIGSYRSMESEYRKRGWFMVNAEYPGVLVLMVAPQLRPAAIQYAIRLDFTDYDLLAPSLQFVNPFSGEVLSVGQVPAIWQKHQQAGAAVIPPTPAAAAIPGVEDPSAPAIGPAMPGFGRSVELLNLVQGYENHPAFLCVPGTREYHAHPYHSNEPWLAHRSSGAGTLHYVLNVVWQHGVVPMTGYNVQLNVQIGPPQFDVNRIP